ncbi:MAG: squalene/phytoene synthase family protein [Ignavibacteria bacterium]|nr:squalene/phytoene synthase family protein [Ignavibacteria bacterium]
MNLLFSENLPLEELISLKSSYFRNYGILESYKFCEHIAKKHYENFPVGSFLLPKEERRFLHSIYAFLRLADDIADSQELQLSKEDRINALEILEKNVRSFKNFDLITNPIFICLKDTIEKKELPIEPFIKLLTAFKMDVNFSQPNNWNDLENYCAFSANPVGELVLRIFAEYSNKTINFSNLICTGLQLVNFWQDLSVDINIGRLYIPKDLLIHYKCEGLDISINQNKEKVGLIIKEILSKTSDYFIDGWKLVWHLKNKRLRFEINATIIGGLRVLRKEKKYGYNLLFKRPKLNYFDYIYILLNALI